MRARSESPRRSEEPREAEEIEAVYSIAFLFLRSEKGIHLAKESGKPSQIHLIVTDHADKRLRSAAAKIVEVILWNESGGDIVLAMPAETSSIEDASLEFDKADGPETKFPKGACRMKKIEMGRQTRSGNGACHGEAIFEERPVEGFAVESDENGALGEACGKFMKKRMLFGKIAHEKLFDLKPPGIPPANAHKKWIGAGAARQASGFRVEKQPLVGIFKSEVRAASDTNIACAREKFESDGGGLAIFGRGKPVSNREMLSEMIFCDACAEKMRERIFLIGRTQSGGTRRRRAHGPKRCESRIFVDGGGHLSTEPVEDSKSSFFGTRDKVAGGADARWAALIASACGNQLASVLNEQVVGAEERLRKADAAGIGVVEIKIGFEEFFQVRGRNISETRRRETIHRASRALHGSSVQRPHKSGARSRCRRALADGGAEIAAIAHEEKRGDRCESMEQSKHAALALAHAVRKRF